MIEYIIMMILSVFFCLLASKFSNKKMSIIFSFCAILIPSIIAGNRSLEIGTDINVYGNYMHYVASNFNMSYFFSIFGYSDILFSIFTITVAKIFKDIHIYLFLLQFLNCFLVYKACLNYKDNVPVWISYFLFLLTLYFRQLNLLRQGLAISFSILATSYLLKNKNKKFWFFTILSIMMHISGILLVLIYFVNKFSNKKSDRHIFFAIMYFSLVILIFLFLPTLKLVISLGILPSKYTFEYFAKYINVNHELDNLGTFFKLLWCCITLLLAGKVNIREKIKDFNFLFHIVFLDFIFWNLNIHIHYIDRLSFYFGYVYMLFLLPQYSKFFKKDFSNQFLFYILLIVLFVFYWYVRFVFQNAGAVYPYVHY